MTRPHEVLEADLEEAAQEIARLRSEHDSVQAELAGTNSFIQHLIEQNDAAREAGQRRTAALFEILNILTDREAKYRRALAHHIAVRQPDIDANAWTFDQWLGYVDSVIALANELAEITSTSDAA